MAETRANLAAEVLYRVGNRDDLDTEAANWVRRAYQFITKLKALEFPEATQTVTDSFVVGINNYALPADYYSIYSVRNNTKNKPIYQESNTKFDALSTSIQQPPEKYTIINKTIYFWPTPDAADIYQLRYRKVFADLTTGASVHELGQEWDEGIIQLASVFGFEHLNELERSFAARRSFRAFVREHRPVLEAELFDRNEAMGPIGMEIG